MSCGDTDVDVCELWDTEGTTEGDMCELWDTDGDLCKPWRH